MAEPHDPYVVLRHRPDWPTTCPFTEAEAMALRALLAERDALVHVEDSDTSDGQIIVSYDRWRAAEADTRLVEWCVANPALVPHQWGRNHRGDPLWIFGDKPGLQPFPGTWREAVTERAAETPAPLAVVPRPAEPGVLGAATRIQPTETTDG